MDEAKAKIAELKGLQQKRIRIGMVNIVDAQLDFAVSGGEGGKFVTSYLGQGPSIRHAGEVAPVVIDLSPEGAAFMSTIRAVLKRGQQSIYGGTKPRLKAIGKKCAKI